MIATEGMIATEVRRAFLNLGCSDNIKQGYWNVDLAPGQGVDEQADLREPWPWPDNSVKKLIAHDVFEHLPDKIHTMNELWRVLEPGGLADIVVPVIEADGQFGPGAVQDPTHASIWHRRSFMYHEAGNPYCERFLGKYRDFQGNPMRARFRIVGAEHQKTVDGPKLHIILAKV